MSSRGSRNTRVLTRHVPMVSVERERWQSKYRHPEASLAEGASCSSSELAVAAPGLVRVFVETLQVNLIGMLLGHVVFIRLN